MKKYLFKQTKKAFSLFLAVIMLMSCWVWMAPEEAKIAEAAASIDFKTTYTVEVNFTISNTDYDSGNLQYRVTGSKGWGTQSANKIQINSFSSEGCNKKGTYTKSFTTTDFPSYIYMETTGGGGGCGGTDARMEVNWIKINGKQVWTGPQGWNKNNSCEIYPTSDDGKTGNWSGTYNWPKPHIMGFLDSTAKASSTKADGSPVNSEINFTLDKMGDPNAKAEMKGTVYGLENYRFVDQYGVEVPYTINKFCTTDKITTHVSGSDGGSTVTGEIAEYIYPEDVPEGQTSDKVVVAPGLQTVKAPGEDGTVNYYLVRKYFLKDSWGSSMESTASAKINIKYQEYDITFDGKGAVDAKDTAFTPVIKDAAGNTLGENGKYVAKNYYNKNITLPATASGTGYTFYGFWSEPQPESKDSDGYFYNKMADFAQPVTTDTFNEYCEMAGAVKSEEYESTDEKGNPVKKCRVVTVDTNEDTIEEKYYDAGVTIDPQQDKTVLEEKTWYAWWCANDYSIKFFDVDGKLIKEFAVKHGQTGNDIKTDGQWPKSAYIDKGYTSGAFKYTITPDTWVNTDGKVINLSNVTFTDKLVLTPKLVKGEFKNKYNISFVNPDLNENTYNAQVDYRDNVAGLLNNAEAKVPMLLNDILEDIDLQYSYEFVGWTKAPTSGKYHIIQENADFDLNNNAVVINTDWVIREDTTFYPVYRRHTKTYVVNFNFIDALGNNVTREVKVKYGEDLVPPVDYVPYEYNVRGWKYTFKGWPYKNGNNESDMLAYSGKIRFAKENIKFEDAALDDGINVIPTAITAAYFDGVETPFKVTFTYPDAKGKEVATEADKVSESANVTVDKTVAEAFTSILDENGNEIRNPFDVPAPAGKFGDDAAVYSYAKSWKIKSGAGTIGLGGETVNNESPALTEEQLDAFVPTSDVEFEAVYANPQPYYTVTYIDGTNSYSEKVLVGSNVPAWTNKVTNEEGEVENKIYIPEDFKANGGTYVFQGWFDAKQTDPEYAATNGNKITTADTVTGNLILYSQFKFVPDKFTIKFKGFDGSILKEGEFLYGADLAEITAEAAALAATRANDVDKEYYFIGWDKAVPAFCEGKHMEFTAQYKESNRYYNVKWYNSRLVDGKWVADKSTSEVDGKVVETNLLATTKHTYNSKLYTPSVKNLICLEPAPGDEQNYVFAGWCYDVKDADGNVIETKKYEKGMKITAEMEFYATFNLSEKVYTITTVVDGKETVYSTTDAIPTPNSGYLDETYHREFDGWYTDEECTTEFVNTEITENITIYAKFIKEEHDFANSQTEKAPTYYAPGIKKVWCNCDPLDKHDEEIPMLVDDVDPTGTIYLGSKGSWSSGGEAAYDTEAKEDFVPEHVNADTDIIITANDAGIGVKLIRAFVYPSEEPLTADKFGAAKQVAMDVYEAPYNLNENGEKVYTEELTNNANFAVKLGDFFVAKFDKGNVVVDEDNKVVYESLKNGETYAVYYYVIDKAGNQLDTKVRTAKFIYDNEAPSFEVTGESNDAVVPTYCGSATVEGIEKDAVLTVNGIEKTVNEDGTYVIEYADNMDNVIITVTDKAGNSYSKKIKVANHSYVTREVLPSCLTDGSKKSECIICGAETALEVIPARGHHVMGDAVVTPADCKKNGSAVYKCLYCDYSITTEYVLDEDGKPTTELVAPALGHKFELDANNEIVYKTVTVSTCKTNGSAEAYCLNCNGELEGGYKSIVLDLDEKNHEKVTVTELEATCTHDGYYTEICDCGVTLVNKNAETDPDVYRATGHGNVEDKTAEWYVKTEATCYQDGVKVLKCLKCSQDIEGQTESIAATGEHSLFIDRSKEEGEDGVPQVQRPAVGVEGYIIWSCKTEGCTYTKTDKYDALVEEKSFDVNFLNEDGTTFKAFKDLASGSTISKTIVKDDEGNDPTKAEDEKYTYTFAGWVEVITNEDGSTTEGAKVKLPLTVTKDITLKATFKATPKLYEHKFYVPNVWPLPASDDGYNEIILVGAYGDDLKPASEPVFKLADEAADAELKKIYRFEFRGWKDVLGNIVTDFKVTESSEFYAYFEAIPVTYDVIYYNGTEFVWSTTVPGGASAKYENYVLGEDGKPVVDEEGNKILIVPEKAYDDNNHYDFAYKWYTDATLKNEYKGEGITSKTQLYAGFEPVAHTYDKSEGKGKVVQDKDCVLPELTEYACACGHTITEQTAEALGHDSYKKDENGNYVLVDGEKVLNAETVTKDDGIYYTIKCSVCGEIIREEKTSYIVVFKNHNGITLQTSVVNAGEDIKFEKDKPVKNEDAEYTYEFQGWCVYGDETKTLVTLGKATADVVYEAVFEGIAKTFRVTFVDANNKTITTKENVAYNTALTEADFPADQADYSTENNHYVFEGWSVDADYNVKSDLVVKPVFTAGAHNWIKTDRTVGATCVEDGGIVWECDVCKRTETRDGASATGHKWVEKEGSRVEPDLEKETDGYYYNICTVCKEESEKIIIPVAKKRDIVITVKDSNGNPIHGAKVELFKDTTRVGVMDTNAEGKVTFKDYEGKYKVLVSGVEKADNKDFEINVGENGYNGEAIMKIVEVNCGCSCHRNGFWGIVFRFFQNIIKFFTGKINCCACPDSRY